MGDTDCYEEVSDGKVSVASYSEHFRAVLCFEAVS